MKIVKKFEIEMAHLVRNAWSTRCSQSVHGHTYNIEVILRRKASDTKLHDDGRMVIDFGLVKKHLHPFIDSFDHAMLLWEADTEEVKKFFVDNFARVVVCPESSSCEMMSAFFFIAIERIMGHIPDFDDVSLEGVIVHETRTGRAECYTDSKWLDRVLQTGVVENTWFSDAIQAEWPEGYALKMKTIK